MVTAPEIATGPLPNETPPASVKVTRSLKCPACGGEIQLRAAGHTLSASCAHCGAVIDTADERLQVIQNTNAKFRPTLLEIGMRGKLDDVNWEIIGYVEKSDKTGMYFWDEYLAFNPYHGFRFIIQQDGHWNFVRVVKDDINKLGFRTTVPRGDLSFEAFLRDTPVVQYVKGEFYWRIRKGDKAKTEDYICPPYMLSFEYADEDISVSLCEYIERDAIKAAFGITQAMPRQKGVAPNQPAPGNARATGIVGVTALIVAFIIHFAALGASAHQPLVSMAAQHVKGDETKTFVSAPFDIPKQSNVLVQGYASVDNSWAEADVTLVNEDTKENTELRQAIEYYHGSDSDGPWTEGSQSENDYMSEIPPGHYHMTYEIDSDDIRGGKPVNLNLALVRDVAPWGNFWLVALLLAVYPVLRLLRLNAFEVKRWENSDFPRGGNS
ncbi:MAG: DUF4178 domain-containing protein [Micavibrio sp.]|nr:DUF4178 domain-containing protein [Micavibrio sp.]